MAGIWSGRVAFGERRHPAEWRPKTERGSGRLDDFHRGGRSGGAVGRAGHALAIAARTGGRSGVMPFAYVQSWTALSQTVMA